MSDKPNLAVDPALKEAHTKQVASLRIQGLSHEAIAKQVRISKRQVANIIKSSEYKALINEIGDHAVLEAKNILKQRVSGLVSDAYEALKNNLDKDNMEAVKVVFKSVGMEAKEDTAQGDTNITVLFPGQSPEPKDVKADIEVSSGHE